MLRADIEHISNSVYTHIVIYTNSSVVDPVIYTMITKLLVFFLSFGNDSFVSNFTETDKNQPNIFLLQLGLK